MIKSVYWLLNIISLILWKYIVQINVGNYFFNNKKIRNYVFWSCFCFDSVGLDRRIRHVDGIHLKSEEHTNNSNVFKT